MKSKIPIKTALIGYSGKMGQSLQKLIKPSPFFKLTEKAHKISCFSKWDPKKIQGVIDFSAPELCSEGLKWTLQNKKAFVSGTTALNLKQKQELKKASKIIPVFYSENMSAGIYLFSQWLQSLPDVKQILLEDFHHKDKKDKPSGTALRLKSNLPNFLQKKLKIKSYRKDKKIGTHRITIKMQEEILRIEHEALNREVFSKGALKALHFIINKKKGFYDLKDLYSKYNKIKPF
ncbi:MAG: hypothetical protein GDA46_02535 [Bdellovibrionales bacterium]|nr:hypothetical protein [Bdellovibrionales bacterium]